MDLLLPLATVAAAAVVIVGYVLAQRRGRSPLGPRPEGELPDTGLALVAGTVGWALLQFVVVPSALAGTDVRRFGGPAAGVFTWTAVNALVAVALLPSATRGTRRPSLTAWKLVAAGLCGAAVVFTVQAGVGTAIQFVYEVLGRGPLQQTIVSDVKHSQASDLVAFAVGAIVLAPFSEEIFFRGILLPAVARVSSARTGLLVQALCFGAIHVTGMWEMWPLAIPLAIVGWGAGWFYLRTGSLAVPIVLHATFNAINFAAIRAGG